MRLFDFGGGDGGDWGSILRDAGGKDIFGLEVWTSVVELL